MKRALKSKYDPKESEKIIGLVNESIFNESIHNYPKVFSPQPTKIEHNCLNLNKCRLTFNYPEHGRASFFNRNANKTFINNSFLNRTHRLSLDVDRLSSTKCSRRIDEIKIVGYQKSKEDPHQMRSRISKQIAQWNIDNKLKHKISKDDKLTCFSNTKKERIQYIPIKVACTKLNVKAVDDCSEKQSTMNESEWKFARKNVKRSQRNTIFYRTSKDLDTGNSISSLLENEHDEQTIDFDYDSSYKIL